jgi:hypothetical protein
MLRRTFALLAVMGLALWIGTASAEDPKPGTHEGKVVKTEPGKLTMTDKQGKNEHTMTIPATAKITFEGKACKLEDLKPGTTVKVTAEKEGDKVVITSVAGTKG